MEVHSGAEIHMQPLDNPTPEHVVDQKKAVTPWEACTGRVCGEKSPCWSRFVDRTCDPMGVPVLEQPVLKHCAPWKGPMPVLSVDALVQEAIQSFLKIETKSEHGMIPHEAGSSGEQNEVSIFLSFEFGSNSQIPPEKGWIVEGFPMTINQAKLFDKAYTGNDPEAKDLISEKLSLAIDPRTPKKPPVTSPAFDVSVLLDISDTVVLKRAADLKYKAQTEQKKRSKNSDVEILEEKIGLDKDQVLHRISGFLDTWPKLEKWFSVYQNTLVSVNAETEESHMCETVKEIIIEEIAKKQNIRSDEEIAPAEIAPAEEKVLPVTDQDLVPPSPEAPPPIEPGSDEWIYVDEPLPQEVIDFLVPRWEMIENAYINTVKAILRCLRDEQHAVIHYIADIKKNFKDYLMRPDLKQEFVSQWQADFNSISDELRDDEETKAELHQRVTDLRDLLWDICDSRREDAEQERTDIMNTHWLPDHRSIAMNYFFSLMQVEVDRFQDTKRLLRDYYRAMEGKIPTEDSQDFTRIPLLDIIDVEQKKDVEQKEDVEQNQDVGQKEDEGKSRRIPLVSWKLLSSEINAETENNRTLRKSPQDVNSENGVATCRNDERVIIYTWQKAVLAVSNMVTAEIEFRQMEEEEECQQQQKLKETQKASQKRPGKAAGKDAKDAKKPSAKSHTKQKGAKQKDSPVPIDPEELRKQELALKIKQEHLTALKHEEEATKSRLELVKEKALAFLEELKMKAEEAYKDMEKWLGSSFLAEMSSVEKLVEVARYHIESSSKIQYEMTLEERDFFINGDVKVVPDPVPELVPAPQVPHIEISGSSTLTISQLTTLHKQFLQVAPKAIKALKQFKSKSNSSSKREVGDRGKEKKELEHQKTKRNRQFPKIWLTKYSWLKYDDERGIMFCAPCRRLNVDLGENIHNFCSGTDDFKLELVTIHQSSEAHAWATCIEAASTASPDTTSAEQMLKSMNSITLGFIRKKVFIDIFSRLIYMSHGANCLPDPWMNLKLPDVGLWFNGNEDQSIKKGCMEPLALDRLKHLIKDSPYSDIPSNEKALIQNDKEVLDYTGEGIISVATLLQVFPTGGSKDQDIHRYSNLEKAGSCDKHFIKIYKELGSEDLTPIPVELLLCHPFMKDLINTYQGYRLPFKYQWAVNILHNDDFSVSLSTNVSKE
ncbi:sperm flagellar 2 [Willisornis vidua]|uniref:Sperm flagellar 2 n=1 Tax=Willisornis vidua TaxID=1566151 RepID=A0ABQ9DYZ7_9PASS|nr:sperm flagellar 2 [Willisornis vidua]